MQTTAVKRANKRLHIGNKAEDSTASTCKFLSCTLHATRRSNLPQKWYSRIENIQENREYLQGVSGASSGCKESHIPAAKIAEMALEACSLCHARTTQQHSKGKHIQSTTIIIGNNTFLNAILFGLIPLCLKIPRKEAFLMLFLSWVVLMNADSPAHPALFLH